MTADSAPASHRPRHRRRGVLRHCIATGSVGVVAALLLSSLMGSTTVPAAGSAESRSLSVPQPAPVLPGPLTKALLEAPKKVVTGPAWTRALPKSTTQAVRTVRTNRWCSQIWCTRTEVWEQVDGRWRIVTRKNGEQAVFRSQVGESGFAAPGRRRQGDMRTPTGDFGIATTFSTTKERPTGMPWRRRLPTSVVSDRYDKTYNTWIELKRNSSGDRRMMSWGLWIDYNNPRLTVGKGARPITGRGSGIFMHTSNAGRPFVPTAGCVQLGDPAEMAWIVRWLKPDANPRIVNNL